MLSVVTFLHTHFNDDAEQSYGIMTYPWPLCNTELLQVQKFYTQTHGMLLEV